MKQKMKKVLQAFVPEFLDWVQAYRFRKRCAQIFGQFQEEVATRLYREGDIYVLSGPFAGMKYFNEVVWGPITPKWIGSYEEELHPILSDEIFNTSYDTVVDVGAAEGYYAVGLALAMPQADIFSFDIDPFARRLQHSLAVINDVSNLTIGKRCTHEVLEPLLGGRSLVISDIEGFEHDLLDPNRAPNLSSSDILVEIHKFGNLSSGEVRDHLRKRFAPTHRTQLISARPRSASRYEHVCGRLVDRVVIDAALDEHRHRHQQWLWLQSLC